MSATPNNESFLEFVLDQLDCRMEIATRRMFSGFGLYGDGGFFGIVYQGRLYFKTDDRTRQDYVTRGATFFQPNAKQALKNYYEVPIDVLEDSEALSQWARTSIDVSLNQSDA